MTLISPAPLFHPIQPQAPATLAAGEGRVLGRRDFEGTLIGSGYYRNNALEMEVALDKDGRLYRKHGQDYFPLGYINAKGNYQFNTGEQGNVFQSSPFQLLAETLRGQLGMALRVEEQQTAIHSSETPMIRYYLTQRGIDGRGVSIAVMERSVPDYDGKIEIEDHAQAVKAVIADPAWGRAPGANTRLNILATQLSKDLPLVADTLDALDAHLYKYLIDPAVVNYFKQIAAQPHPPRVINCSNGSTFQTIGTQVMLILRDRDERGQFKHPQLAKHILGHLPPSELTEDNEVREYQAVVDFVTKRYMQSPRTQAILGEYQQLAHTLANQGVHLVVSMGNSHDALPPRVMTPAGYGINLLCMSDDVIRVAATNNNQTPTLLNDDWVTPFSSRGDGRWNPTLAATGHNVWLDQYHPEATENGVLSGTSASAPNVSGTVALMLQVNPRLTVPQTIQILKQTAVRCSGNPQAEGAGVLDSIQAVHHAAQLALSAPTLTLNA